MTLFKTVVFFALFSSTGNIYAQSFSSSTSFLPSSISIKAEAEAQVYPDPKMVLRRSLIIPGWGQVTNRQTWKVPLVYGLLGGLTYYSVYLTKQYHDYRAAFYNQYTDNTDLRFGPTPVYLDGAGRESLKSNRNFLRNRRDFIYVTIGLAYILNAVDAYVFAHLRSFDVSDDLSMNTRLKPEMIPTLASTHAPVVTLTFSLTKK